MTFRKLAIALAVCALPSMVFAASPVKPGKWQTTMQTEISGMPMKMPPVTVSQCISKEDAENPDKFVPQQRKNSDCKFSDVKMDGNTVSWKMTCEKSKMTGEGSMTYSGESMDGAMHMNMAQGEVNVKYSGKYLGACDK
jgi:hypothetical protein